MQEQLPRQGSRKGINREMDSCLRRKDGTVEDCSVGRRLSGKTAQWEDGSVKVASLNDHQQLLITAPY